MSQTQFTPTNRRVPHLITDDSFSRSFFFPNRNFVSLESPDSLEPFDTGIRLESPDFLEPLESPDFLEPSDTGIRDDSSENSKSIIESPVFDHRFRDIIGKIVPLPLAKAIKINALITIWLLIRDIDKNDLLWHEPFVEYDHSEYMSIEWNKDNKRLYLNIDNDEQWWSTAWEKDSKTKVDFADLDYNNLSIHWEWLFNDQK
ncbi:MAG: hypothetical protein OXG88_07390 [Gammaproteobacteria bacterium]|nr:hypothetical protein [Gammaproteobacteria bacterium]